MGILENRPYSAFFVDVVCVEKETRFYFFKFLCIIMYDDFRFGFLEVVFRILKKHNEIIN